MPPVVYDGTVIGDDDRMTPMDDKPAKRMPSNLWKPGQSANPAGRPPMPPGLREAMNGNAAKATARLTALLDDETAWGKTGWIDAKTQVKLAETAIQRAYGPALLDARFDNKLAEATEDAPHLLGHVLRQAYDALRAEGRIPEYINARRADQMKDVTPDTMSGPQTGREGDDG